MKNIMNRISFITVMTMLISSNVYSGGYAELGGPRADQSSPSVEFLAQAPAEVQPAKTGGALGGYRNMKRAGTVTGFFGVRGIAGKDFTVDTAYGCTKLQNEPDETPVTVSVTGEGQSNDLMATVADGKDIDLQEGRFTTTKGELCPSSGNILKFHHRGAERAAGSGDSPGGGL